MQRLVYLIIVGLFALTYRAVASDENSLNTLLLYTENNPPFNYEENGKAQGAGVEILLKMLEHLNVEKSRDDIIILPWARGYSETQRRKNALLFSTVRTPQREKLFKWVGPISEGQVALLARADMKVVLSDLHSFMKYSYGVSQASREEQILVEAGVNPANFLYVQSNASALQMLARGRVDFWARDVSVMGWVIQKEQLDRRSFKVVHTFERLPLYFALNKDTDDHIVQQLQATVNLLRENGSLTAINNRFFGNMFASTGSTQ